MKSKFGIILIAILAVSSFSLIAGAYAMPFMNYNTVPTVSSTAPNAISVMRNSV